MRLTIDNNDGKGPLDYTRGVVAGRPFRMVRRLNEPVTCTVTIVPGALAMPARNSRVVVEDDSGNLLFTGYVATEPAPELVGQGTTGAVWQARVTAISDDILLSRQTIPQGSRAFNVTAGQALQSLLSRLNGGGLTASLGGAGATVGAFEADSGHSWAANAGALANATRNAWRLMNGTLTMTPVGSVTHALSDSDGTFSLSSFELAMVKELANDVTVCGAEEPSAYVTEYFQGDGTTVLFFLTETPWLPPAAYRKPLIDLFQGPGVNEQLWSCSDPGSAISMGAGGLTCDGGNGSYGATAVAAISNVEMAGLLVLETAGVAFGQQTTGILNGLYVSGLTQPADCVAGFQVTQPGGVTTIAPLINGVVAGSSFTPAAGNMYTLRLRFYSNEAQRVLQAYYAVGTDGGTQCFGADCVAATAAAVLEVQDTTNGVAGAPVELYSGSLASPPPVCLYAPLNAANLQCSIGSVSVQQSGPVWVTSAPPGGSAVVRRLGTAAQGADCELLSSGRLQFYPLSTPKAGETIAVSYRTRRRAVARQASTTSMAMESDGGRLPGSACWIGSVTNPVPRSSADCENAASALLAIATSRAAAWAGKYTAWDCELQSDIWPGDVLAVSSAGITAKLVVRTVEMDLSCGLPGLVQYVISFANDWADELAVKTSAAIPADVWLPDEPRTGTPLASLNGLTATVTGSSIAVAAGATAPAGGGFEVRRRDWSFTAGTGADLVLRSPVPSFSLARQAVVEQYYIRMYDGATPPNYSRFSTALFVNLPLTSS